ncbi:MAG: TDP-N-acetylfucosamine:lipid II N-acetylfucosaminyltransferase [Parabacteroides distasonis]
MAMGNSPFCLNFIYFLKRMRCEDHLFVLITKTDIPELFEYENVLFKKDLSIEMLSYYVKEGYSVIFHSFPFSSIACLFLDRQMLNHVTWWVWGHDLYRKNHVKSGDLKGNKKLVYFLKLGMNVVYSPLMSILWSVALKRKLSHLRAIVVNCGADEDFLRQKMGDSIKIFRSAYSVGYFNEDFERLPSQVSDSIIRVMIGHSAFEFLRHKVYLDKLSAYKNENLRIILPLSYGNMQYARSVADYAKDKFGDKVTVLSEGMDFISYAKLLKSIDVAIFDYEHQSALGNIYLLFLFGKKVYLSPTGVLYKSFLKEGIAVYDCKEIGEVSFKNFCIPSKSVANGVEYARKTFDSQEIEKSYREIFSYISPM